MKWVFIILAIVIAFLSIALWLAPRCASNTSSIRVGGALMAGCE
jgi:hypothetical protein